METRSKARVGHASDSDPEPARATPETSVLRVSSESSLNLTVLLDDGEAGVVGPGHPAVRATTTFPWTTLVEQDRNAAEDNLVRVAEYPRRGSPSDDTVEPRRTPPYH